MFMSDSITEVSIPGLEPKPKKRVSLAKPRAVKAEIVTVDTETRWGIRFHLVQPDGSAWKIEDYHLDKWSRPNPHDPNNSGPRLIDAAGAGFIMSSIEAALHNYGRYRFSRPDGTQCLINPRIVGMIETFSYQAPAED
jgi:hypothetical protein